MTNREAIHVLKGLKRYYNGFDVEDNEAIDMAIMALKEIEQELTILDEINKVKRMYGSIHIYEILGIIEKYSKEDNE